MNRVLLDQGLAPAAARALRDLGWDAAHVSEVGLATTSDAQILTFARDNHYVCVTLDHDFHTHLAISSAGRPSVIFLRVEKLKAHEQASLIVRIWESCADEIRSGAAISADVESVRIRRLPLRQPAPTK